MLYACDELGSKCLVVHFPNTDRSMDDKIAEKLKIDTDVICLENIQHGYYSEMKNILNFIRKYPEFDLTFDNVHLIVALDGNPSE